ncbi:MAG: DEAD/DEAH box helicase, partial [Nitrospiraceae bacterium]
RVWSLDHSAGIQRRSDNDHKNGICTTERQVAHRVSSRGPMLILHAGMCEDEFLLWGECPAEGEVSPVPRRGRKSKNLQPAPLPFGAGSQALSDALESARLDGLAPASRHRQPPQPVCIWLPTHAGLPVASSALIAIPPETQSPVTVTPWTITAWPLISDVAGDFLCACVGKQTLAPGVIVGRDLAFWTVALRLAGSLAARQQFLPGMTKRNGRYLACWQPVIDGTDAERMRRLATRMPAVARALAREPTTSPSVSSVTVLTSFISMVLDHLVRSASAGPPSSALPRSRRGMKAPACASVHDQWLSALCASDGTMTGEPSELARFAEQVREWQRPVVLAEHAPFRLCFRLEDPDAEPGRDAATDRHAQTGTWQVRYLLQAVVDPSLRVPVQEIYTTKGRAAVRLGGGSETTLREYTWSALGQAARICPDIGESLATAAPWGYELETRRAHEFLTTQALALEQAGFGVMLPAWWTRKGSKLRLTAHAHVQSPKMQGGGGLSLNDLIHVDWAVALGNERLSVQELQMLAKLKAPLVKLRGQWVEMSSEEIQAAVEFWKEKRTGPTTIRELVRMALGATTTRGLALGAVDATGRMAELLAQLQGEASFAELPAPPTFQGTLRPYQVRGYSWLAFLRQWGLGACLADDMGLGKTIQTLALIQREWESGSRRPTLLVCPTSVVANWQKEAARFTPGLPVMVHHGVGRTKGEAFKDEVRKQALVISSYALLHRDLAQFQDIAWAGAILDEAQNIKNAETKQARAARALQADHRIALTGTPVENNVGDIWSIMEFLNPGFLGSQAEFKRTFFIPIQADRDPDAAERLKQVTRPFILRRLKTDKTVIADLPEKMEMKVFCTLTKEQASLYAAVVKDAEAALKASEGIQRKGVVLATLSKLKQVCNHPAQFLGDNSVIAGRSGKLARLTEMLEEVLPIGDRSLVFSQFAEMGEILRRHVEETFGCEVLFLHGGVPKAQRDRMVERFQGEGTGPRVFVLSLKAGGTGLNLTRANHVFHYDRWWNPAVENQATDRAFRIGQTKNVQVHKFLCAGTLEEKIDEMIARKQEVAAQIIGAGEGWLTELSNVALKELFALHPEAVGD